MKIRSITTVLLWCLARSAFGAEAGGLSAESVERGTAIAVTPVDVRAIGEVIRVIKQNYIDVVGDETLVEGCRSGLPATSETALGFQKAPAARVDALTAIHDMVSEASAKKPGETALMNLCLRGMLAGLGRSTYFDEEEFRQLQVGSVALAGIGLELQLEASSPRIVAPIEGGPGERAGLKAGDVLSTIDGASTTGLELKDIVRRLQGPRGSTVVLNIARSGADGPSEVAVNRDIIRVEPVKVRTIAGGIGYVRISQFAEATARALAAGIRTLYTENEPGVKGLILDLRNHTGGLLNGAVAVAAAFLPTSSHIVSTDGRTSDSKMRLRAVPEHYVRGRRGEDPYRDLPEPVKSVRLIVLVNRGTASGAEIVAAALQDHTRAKVIGMQTAGAGTIQTILPLAGKKTALRLTTASFTRPNGEQIAGTGVRPDVAVEDNQPTCQTCSLGSADDAIFQAALTQLK